MWDMEDDFGDKGILFGVRTILNLPPQDLQYHQLPISDKNNNNNNNNPVHLPIVHEIVKPRLSTIQFVDQTGRRIATPKDWPVQENAEKLYNRSLGVLVLPFDLIVPWTLSTINMTYCKFI